MSDLSIFIGRGLSRLRVQRGFTQDQLEEITGLKREYISRIENGKLEPKPSTIKKILVPLNYKLSDLFRYMGE